MTSISVIEPTDSVIAISTGDLFRGLGSWVDTLPLNSPMKRARSDIAVKLTVRELELFQRALLKAAEDGLVDRAKAMKRIGELEVLSWQAQTEIKPQTLSAKISKATKEGLRRQRLEGTAGPGGRLGPGRPEAAFDQEKARQLRTTVPPHSYSQIAKLCGVSKATISRFFKT